MPELDIWGIKELGEEQKVSPSKLIHVLSQRTNFCQQKCKLAVKGYQ